MKVIIQRVSEARVSVDQKVVGEIESGFLVLLGIGTEDTKADAEWLVQKTLGLRIFNDAEGIMNRSLTDVGGRVLVISQFTLMAATKKGNRPSYIQAARPEQAIPLYEYFVQKLEFELGNKVETGVFGADMKVYLLNDGPVTIPIDSKNRI